MKRIWLDSYPPGVKPDIDLGEFASLNHMFASSCSTYAGLPAFGSMGASITYGQLERLSRDFAAFLENLPELRKGSRVAIMMPNLLQYPVTLFGILRAGMVAVNVNPLYTARELQHQMRDSGSEAIVVLENFAGVAEAAMPQTGLKYVVVASAGDLLGFGRGALVNFAVRRVKKMVPPWRIDHATSFPDALERGSKSRLHEAVPSHSDIALLQYTGGTTGVSKGVMLTHGNLLANVLQATAWWTDFQPGCEAGVSALPLYHVFSLMVTLFGVRHGEYNLLISNPRDLPRFVRTLRKKRFTMVSGVNALFNGLMNTPGFGDLDFSGLKLTLTGGGATHQAVAEKWHSLTSCPITEGYGLTETSPCVSASIPGTPYTGRSLPIPSTEIAIRDEYDCELAPGHEGEICIRGPQVTQGYWQRPQETAVALTSDGWLRTGDIGIMDDRGYLRITDRKKDMIIVSGFNVYPNEVENVIAEMPGVLECGVIGVADAIGGEQVKAFIKAGDSRLTADAVIAHCRQHLTPYKVPKAVEFRDELPKSPIGKVLRRELRSFVTAAAGR